MTQVSTVDLQKRFPVIQIDFHVSDGKRMERGLGILMVDWERVFFSTINSNSTSWNSPESFNNLFFLATLVLVK